MRLHRLSFAAIGPYPGEHRIDFDALGSSALFLIDGPTGAGKSTIIDALVFALYGDVAGDTDKERLRSAFAIAGEESYCEVDISVSAGRFRIRRTPAFERPKKRGSGTTTVNASVQLWRSIGADSWEPMSALKGEADAEIQRAVGLSREQFVQTVVLPQGEFARFLRAESGDRLPMLERIFATGVFRRVQDRLDEARRQAEREIADAEDAVGAALQRAVGVLAGHAWQEDLRARLDAPGTAANDRWREPLEAVAGQVDAEAGIASDADTAARARAEAAAGALQEARALVGLQRASGQADEREAAAHRALDDARAAAGLAADADLEEQRRSVQAQIDALAVAKALEAGLDREREAIDEDRQRLAQASVRISALQAERERIPGEIRERAALLRARMARAQSMLEQAQSALDGLRADRILGMAGELAGSLEPGAPCPVCGALEHPAPALAHADQVTPERIEEQEEQVAALRSTADHERTASANVDALADADVTAAEPEDDATPSETVVAQVRTLAVRLGDADRTLAEQQVAVSGIAARIAAAEAVLAEHVQAVEDARLGSPSVAARIADLESVRARIDAIGIAQGRVDEAVRQAAEARESLASALAGRALPAAEAMSALEEQAVQEARAAQGAATRLDALRRLQEAFATAVDEVAAAVAEAERRVSAAGPLLQVARAVNGAGGGITLSTFAVQQVFDEVVAAANARLRTMLDGRFQLIATTERTGARRVDQGLGLKVRDLVSDSERRTTTLSGGESFCASLALALGLADTVRAHAGGIEIDTLFVDEGFGSLDTDRLGDVMEELLRLRADGRTVGVISHVTEMRQSIHERIEVIPSGRGSTLRVNWMDA